MRATLLVLALAAAAVEPVSIHTSSFVVQENQAFRVTCTVPRNPENRRLVMGVEGLRSSDRQLDGDDSPVTHNLFIDHVPCGVGPAFCTLIQSNGKERKAVLAVRVIGGDCQDGAGEPEGPPAF